MPMYVSPIKKQIIKAFALLLFLFPIGDSSGAGPQSLPTSVLYIETASGRVQFNVELASTPSERAAGLMYRQSMDMNHGMLFLNPRVQQSNFWMKNTYIPLDVIFIRRNGTIANIVENTEPLSLAQIRSKGRVLGVLEINAGLARRMNIQVGDLVRHDIFNNMEFKRGGNE